MNAHPEIFFRGAGETVQITATREKLTIKKFWVDLKSVKKIVLDPITALSILTFHGKVAEYWQEILKETGGLAKNRDSVTTSELTWELSEGVIISAYPVTEKLKEGRNPRFDLRLFLNVSLRNSTRCFGSKALEFIAPDFETLVGYLRDFSQFLADYVTSTEHKRDHHEPTCPLCIAHTKATVRACTIDLRSIPVVTFDSVATKITEALEERFWGTENINSYRIPTGEFRITIRGDPKSPFSVPSRPLLGRPAAVVRPSTLNFGKLNFIMCFCVFAFLSLSLSLFFMCVCFETF